MFGLSVLSFAAPYVLLALLALPAIYFLLRVTPPSPRRIVFAPLRLLLGLHTPEETPARTPLWLLILRLLAAALVIVALAGPRFDAATAEGGSGPLVLFVDNGWPSAADWPARQTAMRRALDAAGRASRPVVVIGTADRATGQVEVLDAERALKRANDMAPQPWLPDRTKAVEVLKAAHLTGTPDILWLSDGIDHGKDSTIALDLVKMGVLRIYADDPAKAAIALRPPENTAQGFSFALQRLPSAARAGRVAAFDARGQIVESAPFRFGAKETEAKVSMTLPLELRNEVARVAVQGMQTAGSVQLLDARFRHRAVGLVSGGTTDSEQPLLSDVFYIRRALLPYADIQTGSIAQMLAANVSVLVLADIGELTADEHRAIVQFLEKGGVLLRFAGARLAAHAGDPDNDLVPEKLRGGERLIGSAMSWSEPQHLAGFSAGSPFEGLSFPSDVTVSRQILTEPSVELAANSWARLTDGTPLVTAAKRGRGWIVLFHVSASPGWSSLPLSGLYVDMLRRVVALSEGTPSGADALNGSYAPYRALDGYGRLGNVSSIALPIKATELDKIVPGPEHPPGLYGNENAFLALNAVTANDTLKPLNAGQPLLAYTGDTMRAWKWPLLLIALLLLLADAVIALILRGLIPLTSGARRFARIAPLALFLLVYPLAHAHAETSAKDMAAALSTRLAYVETGDAATDAMSKAGLYGLGLELAARTAYEPDQPVGVNVETEDLSFYPLLYWPMVSSQKDLSSAAIAKVDSFMRQGGTILFDTQDAPLSSVSAATSPGAQTLRRILGKLDIPPLEPIPADHVLTKTFFLLREFPGRWSGGQVWVEALPANDPNAAPAPARGGDGVSPVVIGGNDWASAWARDQRGQALAAVVPGGEMQREQAFRFGINLVMYTLTGNYKADQVHVPALLERLGE
jgi:hypothetical protein